MTPRTLAAPLRASLKLAHPPIAVGFLDEAPPGVPRIAAPEAAGCAYWKLAAEGRSFYTEKDDHLRCAIGAHTHGIDLDPAKSSELMETIRYMVGLEYLSMSEVPEIPRVQRSYRFVAYAPLNEAAFRPDAVLFRGSVRQIMCLTEAARAAGIEDCGTVMGRPACAVLPATLATGYSATSVGCIGNRIYTGLGDGELYFALAGPSLDRLLERLPAIVRANDELERYHQGRVADRVQGTR